MNDAEKLKVALAGLKYITNNYGKVCDEFEICTHSSCSSSSGAWLKAQETLQIIDKECVRCVINPQLRVIVEVQNLTIHGVSCQDHPLEIGRKLIRDNNFSDEKGYSISYEPL